MIYFYSIKGFKYLLSFYMLFWITGMMVGMSKMQGFREYDDKIKIIGGYIMFFTVAFFFGAKVVLSHNRIIDSLLHKLF